jgi:hypothetical protein
MRGDGAAWACVPLSIPIDIGTGVCGVITLCTSMLVSAWSNAEAESSRHRFSVNGEGGEWWLDIEIVFLPLCERVNGQKCEFELTWMFDWATKLSETK